MNEDAPFVVEDLGDGWCNVIDQNDAPFENDLGRIITQLPPGLYEVTRIGDVDNDST